MFQYSLLYKEFVEVSPGVRLHIPTVGEILDFGEKRYYDAAFILSAMPYDVMVYLHGAGVDFSKITDYELFLSLFPAQESDKVSLILPDLNPRDFAVVYNKNTQEKELLNLADGRIINRVAQTQIGEILRTINFWKKNTNKPANPEAYEYMIYKARKRLKRARRKEDKRELERLIIALVNCSEFKYDFNSVREINIYALNACVRQILNRLNYEQVMGGVYAGTVDYSKLNKSTLDWLDGSL